MDDLQEFLTSDDGLQHEWIDSLYQPASTEKDDKPSCLVETTNGTRFAMELPGLKGDEDNAPSLIDENPSYYLDVGILREYDLLGPMEDPLLRQSAHSQAAHTGKRKDDSSTIHAGAGDGGDLACEDWTQCLPLTLSWTDDDKSATDALLLPREGLIGCEDLYACADDHTMQPDGAPSSFGGSFNDKKAWNCVFTKPPREVASPYKYSTMSGTMPFHTSGYLSWSQPRLSGAEKTAIEQDAGSNKVIHQKSNRIHPLAVTCKKSEPPLNDRTDGRIADETVSTRQSDTRKCKRWTSDEDAQLMAAVALAEGPPHRWKDIAETVFRGNRNAAQCKGRWKKTLNPQLKHTSWTQDEDSAILEGKRLELNWPDISATICGRSTDQVRARYLQALDPDRKRSPWTPEEDETLIQAQSRFGNQWKKISKHLPGRTENDVKNRWHNLRTSNKRKVRRLFKP